MDELDYHSFQGEGNIITYGCYYGFNRLCGVFFDDDFGDTSVAELSSPYLNIAWNCQLNTS